MDNHTFTSWPSNIMSCWSFSGAKKPIGSPMFDAIRGDWEGLKEAVQYMKKFPFQQSGVKQVCVCLVCERTKNGRLFGHGEKLASTILFRVRNKMSARMASRTMRSCAQSVRMASRQLYLALRGS